MKAVIQRVTQSSVTIENEKRSISAGLTILIAIASSDTELKAKTLADKILNLRIFPNEEGKFDKSVIDIKGELLAVSQFTLYGDCTKGRRPDFTQAASPANAKMLYEKFVEYLKQSGLKVVTGEFQAMMQVEIHNDGPVTLIVEN
ncbi:MAG: D-tyrosyl-tRNA(Tyr) deacylase [Elusimicrobia bacterium RIFOXYA2_FULL_39_19]|nr:MAG: D-tyrosyl-tRNA(Tyr) deacylase [Elusimicrobia bacterium RIFOXYA2_FULL_39_19]